MLWAWFGGGTASFLVGWLVFSPQNRSLTHIHGPSPPTPPAAPSTVPGAVSLRWDIPPSIPSIPSLPFSWAPSSGAPRPPPRAQQPLRVPWEGAEGRGPPPLTHQAEERPHACPGHQHGSGGGRVTRG